MEELSTNTVDFGELDWNSSMYGVYEKDYVTANGGTTDQEIYDTKDLVTPGEYTEAEKQKVNQAYLHISRTDNPHNTVIDNISGLKDKLKDLEINDSKINKDSAVDIDSKGKITVEWENV